VDVVRGHQHAAWTGAAIAIGNFDGVHLGHRALVAKARALAGPGVKAVALTFDPHPSAVVGSGAPRAISSLERRLELLAECGLDAVVVEPFTRELAALSADAFVDDILVQTLRAKAVIVGYDFTYGAMRGGSTSTLEAHGARAGFEVAIVPAVEVDGAAASSTRIRGLLGEGKVEAANRVLGRAWDVDGTVVHGAKRGRAIGIPTANIAPASELLIPGGIYACTLTPEGGAPLPAVASLGRNPTFVDQEHLVLEVHVLDWAGDLYDRRVRTTVLGRLRDEAKFPSIDALLVQIRRDIDDARLVIENHQRLR
jgi:riboflavin kinase/FMN adenylyltransferase